VKRLVVGVPPSTTAYVLQNATAANNSTIYQITAANNSTIRQVTALVSQHVSIF
jgi:hypothetical protein